MKINYLEIKNYKFIKELKIKDIDNACIFVGKNNTGKTVILDAILTAFGQKEILPKHFYDKNSNIEISLTLSISEEDIDELKNSGIISRYKRKDLFMQDFINKFPSYKDGYLKYTFIANKDGKTRFYDGYKKDNQYLPGLFPKVYYIDHRRDIKEIEDDILTAGIREKTTLMLKENRCMFDSTKACNACFNCIGVIEKKSVNDLTVFETEKLLEYKLVHSDSSDFLDRLNLCFQKNTGMCDSLVSHININYDDLLNTEIVRYRDDSDNYESIYDLSEGVKSIYILSLLEAYSMDISKLPCIIMIEDPELFLHPKLQKTASEVLYRLSEKNQVFFSTHSPQMIFNFNKRQIKQVQLDKSGNPVIRENNDISRILDDLGYNAIDLMNVDFVFIVEGKQDKSRLPLIFRKFYPDLFDESGSLSRISIINTNSCTNIKTYANLKYINQLYLKDNFMMIRDGDGLDANRLKDELCDYYKKRGQEDPKALPNVSKKNVLILKYYSLENYFLNPEIMAKIGVVDSKEQFFDILFEKYKSRLSNIISFKRIADRLSFKFSTKQEMEENYETILKYGRGHNLFDIYYGRYKGNAENEILTKYIENSSYEDFKDILDAINAFVYFKTKTNIE